MNRFEDNKSQKHRSPASRPSASFLIAAFVIVSLAGAVACAFVWLLIEPVNSTSAQSGRGQLPESKRPKNEKPQLPDPLPKIRLPENFPQKPDKKDSKEAEDVIRINSDLVNVIVTLAKKPMDGSGDLVGDDFEISEDGVTQEVANFSREADQPLNLVLLYDTSLSVAKRLDFERRATIKFFERVMRPQDRAALFSVSTDVAVLQEFTNRLPSLINATKQLKAEGATSLYDAVYLAADYLREDKQSSTGRRVIVIVSDGGDTISRHGLLDALNETQKSDAVIFAVYTAERNPSQNLRDLAAERALETMTSETGGEVFRPKASPGARDDASDEQSLKELDQAFARLADELRTQYVLGFFSTNEKRDGSYRKLNVRIKRQGYAAKARAGYYAPKS